LISRFVRAYVLGRLLRGGRRRRRPRGGYLGPFPTYSTRTRGGSRVRVTGCCLPLPLALAVTAGLGARTLLRR
jgi:hypothetical protein